MTDRARDAIDALQWLINYYPKWHSEADPCAVMHSAIDLIESLAAELDKERDMHQHADERATVFEEELEQVKRERDAAIEDMKKLADRVGDYTTCTVCSHEKDHCRSCVFEWRGVKE